MMEERELIFRKEAIEHNAGAREGGDVLRLSPAWTRWTFWLLLAAVGFYGAVGVFVRISEYATGPAVVRMEDRLDVRAPAAGRITSVEVQPGERVQEGQILARLFDGHEQAGLDRYNRELELLLLRRMRDLSDEGARQALSSLRAQRDLAEAQLENRVVRAPQAGVVSDVRVRRGQHIVEGSVVASLVREGSPLEVLTMLPGGYRPLIARGEPLRLELQGFPHEYQELTIDGIGDELVGPAEVRRYLGPELADSLAISGAVVLVRARAPSRFFEADGKQLAYFDGMLGTAQVRVKSERIVTAIVPGLKAILP